MRTRRSGRTSPLAYDPEVERSARLRRKAVRHFSTNLDFSGLEELFTEMSDDNTSGAKCPPWGVDSYYRPGNFEDPSPIIYLAAANGAVSNFKIQPNLIAILLMFRGREEPYTHLREFLSIADTYQVNNTTNDGVRLRLFPFLLKIKLRPGSHLSNHVVSSHGLKCNPRLEELFTKMLEDDASGAESPPRGVESYYRPGNTEDPLPIVYLAAANGAVSNFKIQPNLIAILPVFRGREEPYPHLREFFSIADTYQVNKTTKDGELVKVFYDGLDYHNQQFVMATSGGTFFSRTMEEEWEFFEKLSKGSKTQASVDQNNNHTSFANFVSNQHGTNSEISELSKKVDLLLRNIGKGVPNVSQMSHDACSMCGYPSHLVNNSQYWGAPSNEEVNGVYGHRPRNDPFSESYNPGWRNHPNFRWKDDDNCNRHNNTQQQNHGYKPRYEGGDSSNF
ncbi:hypothetical protein Tco_0251426 [Tanacetum coccineum]